MGLDKTAPGGGLDNSSHRVGGCAEDPGGPDSKPATMKGASHRPMKKNQRYAREATGSKVDDCVPEVMNATNSLTRELPGTPTCSRRKVSMPESIE